MKAVRKIEGEWEGEVRFIRGVVVTGSPEVVESSCVVNVGLILPEPSRLADLEREQ